MPERSHCLSSIFAHYILNSPPPTKIISSLHKIQIIGEWHDLWNLKHLMADVKAQGEACFPSWFIPLAGWPCFTMKVHILSLINLATQQIFWQASLFSAIISPIMDHGCAQSHPVHSVSRIKINLNIQKRLAVLWLYYAQYKNKDNQNLLNNFTFILERYFEAMHFLLYLTRGIVPKQLISTLEVTKVISFLLTWNSQIFICSNSNFPTISKAIL